MDVAIVGGGIGGMTATLLLARRGMNVTLYEKEDRLGGRLVYEENGPYRIDRGPTIVLLPDMLLGILEEAGIERSRLPLVECEPLCRIHYQDGTSFRKFRDRERQLEELERVFPGEKEGFRRYMKDMEQAYARGYEAFLSRPFLRRTHFFTWRNMRLLIRMKAYKSVKRMAADYFRDERLQDAYSLQTLYIGGAPFRSPGVYTLIPYAEQAQGVWYVRGGYAGLAALLERELASRGVSIRTGTPIRRLTVAQGRCQGVEWDTGSSRHDAVVYNGDFPHLAGMLPPGLRRGRQPGKSFVPSSGCVLIYLGLNRRWPDAEVHQFFLPSSLTAGLRQIFDERRLPDDPAFYVFNPCSLDGEAAPPDESVLYVLIPVPTGGGTDWTAEGPALAERVLEAAERRGFPGLREAIRWRSVRTPADAERDGLYRGGSFGIAPSFGQSAAFRPQIVPYPDISGLFSVGASVHPGGGVPIVMQGAKLLSDHLTREGTEWNSLSV